MPVLNKSAFLETFNGKMSRVGENGAPPPFDFWPYVEGIPVEDFGGFDCSAGQVDLVWRTADEQFEHVLINSKEDRDVFMVIVLNRVNRNVVGHHLLDLKHEYGLRDASLTNDVPNKSPDPTPAPGMPPAGQESRHG